MYRQADGLWAATIELQRDPDTGKRRRKVVRARTKRGVLARRDAVGVTIAQGLPVPDSRTTTEAYLRGWLDDVLPGTVRDSTAEGYRWLLGRYVIPQVGTVPLSALAPRGREPAAAPHGAPGPGGGDPAPGADSPATGAAPTRSGGATSGATPAALVDAPPSDGTKLDDAMTAKEARAVLAAAQGDRLAALAELVLSVGLRKGEAMALRWDDLDLDAGTVHVGGRSSAPVASGDRPTENGRGNPYRAAPGAGRRGVA